MPKIEMERSHRLSVDEARAKVDSLVADLEKRYGLKCSWAGNRLSFQRTGVKGHVDVGEDRVAVLVDLSMVLGALKSKVEQRLKSKMDEEFA
ncbi:MAG: polyhydroxyalkanoic acid system family protein [Deltaproteobacteria bacterium]|nr:polyhydroxyalkanoic acid system family protein [Deltaproteobacteria bacterium]